MHIQSQMLKDYGMESLKGGIWRVTYQNLEKEKSKLCEKEIRQ